jgi:hypothetical protein
MHPHYGRTLTESRIVIRGEISVLDKNGAVFSMRLRDATIKPVNLSYVKLTLPGPSQLHFKHDCKWKSDLPNVDPKEADGEDDGETRAQHQASHPDADRIVKSATRIEMTFGR